jgi:RNA 2',3'-cyclic 3'-phosphodiesterase
LSITKLLKKFIKEIHNNNFGYKSMNRYFFAIKPDHKSRDRMMVLARSNLCCSGRWVKNDNLHLTLLFLGSLTDEQQYNLLYKTNKIDFPELELRLNKTGYFKKSQVAWLGFDTVPESLLILNQQLLKAAKQSKIAISQQTYKPHVTLIRKSDKINSVVVSSVNWKVSEFFLFKSVDTRQGIKYQVVEKFNSKR